MEAIDSSDDEDVAQPVAQQGGISKTTAKKEPKAGQKNSNFATLASLNNSSSGDENDEKGQAFYAGGSQTSGQQILGPPRKNPIKDYVSEVFKQAQAGQMEQFDDDSHESGPSTRSFGGAGYRLGQTEDDHVKVASSSASANKKKQDCETVTVRVYRQGFTVDDGELRPYEDPRNRQFFESITHNEIPAELRKPGSTMVHVNVEDHLSEDYVKRTPKFKAFAGSGHTLGSPAPATTEETAAAASSPAAAAVAQPSDNQAENEAKASANLNIQEEQPTTMLSIRLADGGRLSARFNLSHTVQDIHLFIQT